MSNNLTRRIRDNLAAWLPTQDHTLEARRLMEEAAIELERLRAQVAATGKQYLTVPQVEHLRQNLDSQGKFDSLQWHVDFAHAVLDLAASPAAPAQQAEPGCTRSHPHENMSAACEAETIAARAANAAAQQARSKPDQETATAQQAAPSLTVGERVEPDVIEWADKMGAIGHPDRAAAAIRALSAQPAQPVATVEDPVTVPRGLIGAACAAIERKHDAPKTLAHLRRYTTGDLSGAASNRPAQAEPVAFDAEGFRAWVLKNMPDDTTKQEQP